MLRTESATDAKNHFGELVDAALREPVVIQRSGRNAVVMMAYDDYEEWVALMDRQWGEKAKRAKRKGLIGTARSKKLIDALIHVDD